MLTKRERVMRTVRFEETDRVPLYDLIQNDAVIEHYAGQELTYEDGDWIVGLAVGRTLDMTRSVNAPQRPALITNDDGTVVRRERWTSWFEERPFDDVESFTEWVKEQIRLTRAKEFGQNEVEEFRAYVEGRIASFAASDPTGRNDPTVLVMESPVGLDGMYSLPGIQLFTYFMTEHPDLVEEWLDARNQAEVRRAAAMADPELVPIVLVYDDIAHKTGTMFSPDWLRTLWAPHLARLCEAWHTRDTLCLFHSDGNLWPILDELVTAGIDGLNPLEQLAGMDIGAVRERYPTLFLTGGIDVSQLLAFGTPGEVEAACDEAVRATNGRGYFLGSSTELHWEVPLDNAMAMFETPVRLAWQRT